MWTNRAYGVEYVDGTKDRLTVNNYSPETLDLHQGPSLPPILSRSRRPIYVSHPASADQSAAPVVPRRDRLSRSLEAKTPGNRTCQTSRSTL